MQRGNFATHCGMKPLDTKAMEGDEVTMPQLHTMANEVDQMILCTSTVYSFCDAMHDLAFVSPRPDEHHEGFNVLLKCLNPEHQERVHKFGAQFCRKHGKEPYRDDDNQPTNIFEHHTNATNLCTQSGKAKFLPKLFGKPAIPFNFVRHVDICGMMPFFQLSLLPTNTFIVRESACGLGSQRSSHFAEQPLMP